MVFFAHESACVEDGAAIGEGTHIWHFSHVMRGAAVGVGCVLGQNTFIAGGAKVGNRVRIQNNVSIYSGVEIDDDVFLGPSCVFTNVRNPRAHVDRKAEFVATTIGKGATVGANATVVCGCKIGQYAFIGAGAVVTRDVPDYGLVLGVPARLDGYVSRRGVRLADVESGASVQCPESGERYTMRAGVVICLEDGEA